MKKLIGTAVLCFTLLTANAVRADEVLCGTADACFEAAQKAFDARTRTDKLEQAEKDANRALELAAADAYEFRYKANLLASQIVFYVGGHVESNDEKMKIYDRGMAYATVAKKLNVDRFGDKLCEAYFYYAINLGQWATAKGIVASLSRKDELIANIDGADSRVTLDGKPGHQYESYGPPRVRGRMYYKLPVFAGGSRSKARDILRDAWKNGSDHSLNGIYLAEVLMDGPAAEQTEAKGVLENMVDRWNNNRASYDQTRLPETEEDIEQAVELLKELQ